MAQINGKVKLLKGEGKVEDVKAGVEEDPDAEVGIACPLCGAVFDLRTGERLGWFGEADADRQRVDQRAYSMQ